MSLKWDLVGGIKVGLSRKNDFIIGFQILSRAYLVLESIFTKTIKTNLTTRLYFQESKQKKQ